MTKTDEVAPAPERLHALDAVRGFALLLGIVLHATLSFLPTPSRVWIIQDSLLEVVAGIAHGIKVVLFGHAAPPEANRRF